MRNRIHGWALALAVMILVTFAAGAQANVTLPGLNGKIAFASDRDSREVEDLRGDTGCVGDDDECGFDIFTMNPDGSGLANVTNLSGKDDKPSWSPDGTQIAFESRRDCHDDESDNCESDIFVMNADGTNVRQLTDGPTSDTHPTWSPDGNTIAFERFDLMSGDGPDRIATVPAAGGPITDDVTGLGDSESTADLLPAWSPDGTRLAVTRISTPSSDDLASATAGVRSGDLTGIRGTNGTSFTIHTYIVTLATQEAQPVGEPQPCAIEGKGGVLTCQFDLNPAWPPSGARIAFHRLQLNFADVPNGEAELRTEMTGFADDVDIIDSSLDGSDQNTLAEEVGPCTSEESGPFFAAGTRGDPVPCVDDYKPAYSPDSTRIAFHSDRGNTACFFNQQGQNGGLFPQSNCRPQLWLMNSDGSGATGPIAPANIRGEEENQATDRNADWQRVLPPAPPVVTTPTAPARRDTRRPRVRVAALRACTASSRLRIPVRIAERGGIRSVRVSLDGRRILSTRRLRFTITINARRLRSGRHRVRVVATDASGNRTTVNRSFVRCARQVQRPTFTG